MSIDLDVLNESYSILKQYIPNKDRQEAADNLMSVMVDMLTDEQLRDFGSVDAFLSRALKEYVGEEEDDYEEDE